MASTFDGMLDRLEAAFHRQRQFTADASHELRTPVALIRGQIEVALERRRRPAEYEQVLESLKQDTERLGRLLGELLTLARADAGDGLLAIESLDLSELVRQVLEVMRPMAVTGGVMLRSEASDVVLIQGDQTRLTQLVVNLISNAIRHTPNGGVVTVSVIAVRDEIRLQVHDTGVGIPVEHLPFVFDRFYRVDPSRQHADGGAGLGLAICKWVAEAHHGAIDVASTVNQGTSFTVRLPGAHVPADGSAPESRDEIVLVRSSSRLSKDNDPR